MSRALLTAILAAALASPVRAEDWPTLGRDRTHNAVSPERTDTPMRRRAFPNESMAGLLSARDVARATLRLISSDLTGQVLDIRRHDALPSEGGESAEGVASGDDAVQAEGSSATGQPVDAASRP